MRTTHYSGIGLALNPSAPEPDDRLTSYVEEVEQDGIEEIEDDLAEEENAAALVRVLADASKSGLIRMVAEGRALANQGSVLMDAFRALAKLADRLENDRNERVMAEAERRREDFIDVAVSP